MTKAYDILNGTGITDPNPAFKTAAERYPHTELKTSLPVPEELAASAVKAMTAKGRQDYLGGDFVEPDANAGLEREDAIKFLGETLADGGRMLQRQLERHFDRAEAAAGIAGGINGCPAAAGSEAPLREFVMCSPARGGWVILSQRYGNPIAAFTSFKEACDWLEPRVAK